MIILFGNQKGGCGKTTNCIQFANYLVEKGKEVIVLDLDFQRSLSDRRKEDIATYDNEPKYEVIQTDISNVAKMCIRDSSKLGDEPLLKEGYEYNAIRDAVQYVTNKHDFGYFIQPWKDEFLRCLLYTSRCV